MKSLSSCHFSGCWEVCGNNIPGLRDDLAVFACWGKHVHAVESAQHEPRAPGHLITWQTHPVIECDRQQKESERSCGDDTYYIQSLCYVLLSTLVQSNSCSWGKMTFFSCLLFSCIHNSIFMILLMASLHWQKIQWLAHMFLMKPHGFHVHKLHREMRY